MTNFILQGKIKNLEICDKLIEYHKVSPYKQYRELPHVISTDVGIDASQCEHPTVLEYLKELQKILNKYIKKYSMSNYYSPFQIREKINIQLYKPSEGYPVWHTERCNITL
jgi:CRISPR/Cas system Type II protein with McrA/HNH and RuvC-like nuclease domain